MPNSPITIAVDGPSGSGKSSVSRAVARRLGLAYLDTGAMYRALTWWCLERGLDLADQTTVAAAAKDLDLRLSTDPDAPEVRVAGTDVSQEIRTTRISGQVSQVATNLGVRAELRRRQRALVEELRAARGGVVVEGRDITTVVAPDAEHRILLTASEEARLTRRTTELHGTSTQEQLAATRDQVVRRDRDDASVSAFFEPADGVHGLDTSHLSFEESVRAVLDLVAHGATHPIAASTPDLQEHR
ncbi:(d)CMP kinase [Ornithinimicrobium avium]|uniref:Cytidylate kinase n=1 Tax=Ornithinimicrobium avium TaxID=2283195 RepID=A0A345NJR3_9MICO|nr:(d)CMP kinase [Ornithinimicrobium avium]AXH95271.1 (d)CMP kinase [Ornithinimicrobium avium]